MNKSLLSSKFLCFLFLSVLWLLPISISAQQPINVYARVEITLHAEPTLHSQSLATLPAETMLIVEGRDATPQWLLVRTVDAAYRGWVTMGYLYTDDGFNPYEIPISTEQLAESLAPVQEYSTETAAKIERLMAVPLLYNMDTEQVQAIFQRGQELGNRPDVFIKIGDSNTANGDFFRPFGLSRPYCDYGAYQYLQETVNYFETPPRTGSSNSFESTNFTVVKGLTGAALLDSFWATDPSCEANESLLACEQRIVKPAFSVMMIGLMDLEYYDVASFELYLDEVIAESVAAGVIPIQTTFTVLLDYISPELPLWEKSLDYNLAILEVAERYGTPVIHLWRALQTLPDYGIGPDRTHLKAAVGEFCSFTGEELLYGGTMRNLLSLQALDVLRRSLNLHPL
jgi:hypothetical protein